MGRYGVKTRQVITAADVLMLFHVPSFQGFLLAVFTRDFNAGFTLEHPCAKVDVDAVLLHQKLNTFGEPV
jgi:hypothetical protein